MSEVQTRPGAKGKSGYLPSLDGWRALAVMGVMMTHDGPWTGFGFSTAHYKGYGGDGVYLFFAISGFLITTRILEEEKLVGRFNIRGFYIRRLFRIQPVALCYLAVIACLMLSGVISKEWLNWIGALCLFNNFLFHPPGGPSFVGHFWTLAVEEHFYILLSLALFFVRRHRAWLLFLLFLAFTLPLTISYGIEHGWYHPYYSPRSTLWQLKGLFLAAFIAVLVQKPRMLRAVKAILRPWVAFLLTLVIVELRVVFDQLAEQRWPLDFRIYPRQQWFFAVTYLPVIMLVATVFHPRSWLTRFLETRPLRFVGKISYSLYLWHVAVFVLWAGLLEPSSWGAYASSPLGRVTKYALAFGIATISYYYIEKPLIRVGHRLAPSATPGRPELADLPVEAPENSSSADGSLVAS
jgi:peptidoglycan/LPS O-acetylase OafA/YrhL